MKPFMMLENRLEKLYAKLPPLSPATRRWLADNAWWIALVIAIAGTLVTLNQLRYITTLNNLYVYQYQYPYNSVSPTTVVIAAIVTFVLSVISIILLYRAVTPLKQLRRSGWDGLFAVEIINIVSLVAGFVILIQQLDIVGLVWGLIVAAIELYLLFQIRPQFGNRAANTKEAKVVVKK